jgi:hypothetical protein
MLYEHAPHFPVTCKLISNLTMSFKPSPSTTGKGNEYSQHWMVALIERCCIRRQSNLLLDLLKECIIRRCMAGRSVLVLQVGVASWLEATQGSVGVRRTLYESSAASYVSQMLAPDGIGSRLSQGVTESFAPRIGHSGRCPMSRHELDANYSPS